MTIDDLKGAVRDVPDFPIEGILFKDITPILKDPVLFKYAMSLFEAQIVGKGITKVAAIDARGFLFGGILCERLGIGLVPIRKQGKLPYKTYEESYDLEYGQATLQLKPGNGNVAIVDDVLATGGTLKAAAELCADAGYTVKSLAVLIDLAFLHDDDFNWQGITPRAVMTYE